MEIKQMPQNDLAKKVCTADEMKATGCLTDLHNQDLSDQDFWLRGSVLDNL